MAKGRSGRRQRQDDPESLVAYPEFDCQVWRWQSWQGQLCVPRSERGDQELEKVTTLTDFR